MYAVSPFRSGPRYLAIRIDCTIPIASEKARVNTENRYSFFSVFSILFTALLKPDCLTAVKISRLCSRKLYDKLCPNGS